MNFPPGGSFFQLFSFQTCIFFFRNLLCVFVLLCVQTCVDVWSVCYREHSELLVLLSGLQHAGPGTSGSPLHHSDQRDPLPSFFIHL